MQTDDLAAQMVREIKDAIYAELEPTDMPRVEAIARRFIEKALTAQAEEIERLRGALNATADEQDERSAQWERAIAAGLKRMTVSKDYARGAHNESLLAAIKIRAALKAAQEVKA